MKKISSAINKFCYKHPRFGISRLMMYIVGLTALVYIIDAMDTTGNFLAMLEFDPAYVLKGELWRIISWIFIPINRGLDNILWLAISLYFYYFIGSTLERAWGSGKLTIFYTAGMLLNMLYALFMYVFKLAYILPSPVYLNLSMFFAFASLAPETRIMFMFFIPVKIKWLAWLNAAYYGYVILQCLAIRAYFYAAVPIIAVLNFILICGLPLPTRSALRHRKTAASFHNTIQNARRVEEDYRHRCTVCGRTDSANPELDFRYCTRCEGFRCYCEEHIGTHEHF